MTMPGFTAEAALGPNSRPYSGRSEGRRAAAGSAIIPQQGMTYGVGPRCIGHHMYYLWVEAEDPDHIAVHTEDLHASC